METGNKSTVMLVYSQWEDCAHETVVHANYLECRAFRAVWRHLLLHAQKIYLNIIFDMYFRHQGKVIMLQKRFEIDGKCCQKGEEQ